MASSSMSSMQKSYQYDVFLSFRGEDTRKNFVDHLYAALQHQGIHTYKDDERLEKGKRINDGLLKSIEDSKFCIIVMSKNYPSSSWCLDELVKIMECHKKNEKPAYPVFYDVDPSEVRKQNGPIGEAFAKHKNELEVGKWREALTEVANLSGWDLRKTADGHEAKVVKLIVEQILLELRPINHVDESLIGMEHRLQDLESSLQIGSDDVCMIGIKGMGGSGKTTLARAIFDRLSTKFEAKSFVENVREVSKASLSGLFSLQRQVLSDLLQNQVNNIGNVHDAKTLMKTKLCGKKVLVVLDDVDHKDQLDALAGNSNWFMPGSKIIITTRDEQVLISHRVNHIRDVNLLSDEEAICLFSMHAFGRNTPNQEYEILSLKVIHYASGLPLTIKVLGSFLCGKDKSEWIDALERLKTIPLKETLEKLELSYESLEDDYKEIFLDVACLLKGWEKEKAIRMLESCGFHARNGLRVLEQKSLLTINVDSYREYLSMHDHIEEMGKNIVRRLHPYEPNRHSRLWIQEEVEDVLRYDLGTEATRSINLKLTPEIVVEGLRNMKKLRFLLVDHRNYDFGDHVKIDKVCQHFPNSLRFLSWNRYPHSYLPKTFQANNLVSLIMYKSRIQKLWEGEERKVLNKLRSLELRYAKLRTLNVSLIPNLERLDLKGCYDLVELQVPIGCLDRLWYLNLESCEKLKSLSFVKHLESLEVLNLGFLFLRMFPNIIPGHSNNSLLKLNLCANEIEAVPSSIGNLRKLVYLNLNGCTKLKSLPASICRLQQLRSLYLVNCGIEELPKDLGKLESLKKLSLNYTHVKHLPDSICMLRNLKTILLINCVALEKLPENLGHIESLEELDISFCSIRYIPRSICKLGHLKTLILERCVLLEELPEDLGQIESLMELSLRRCKIRDIPASICKLKNLKDLDLYGCSELQKLPENLGDLECLEKLNLIYTSISHLPHSILLLKGLEILGFESRD